MHHAPREEALGEIRIRPRRRAAPTVQWKGLHNGAIGALLRADPMQTRELTPLHYVPERLTKNIKAFDGGPKSGPSHHAAVGLPYNR